eukprot:Awhi_evm1s14237
MEDVKPCQQADKGTDIDLDGPSNCNRNKKKKMPVDDGTRFCIHTCTRSHIPYFPPVLESVPYNPFLSFELLQKQKFSKKLADVGGPVKLKTNLGGLDQTTSLVDGLNKKSDNNNNNNSNSSNSHSNSKNGSGKKTMIGSYSFSDLVTHKPTSFFSQNSGQTHHTVNNNISDNVTVDVNDIINHNDSNDDNDNAFQNRDKSAATASSFGKFDSRQPIFTFESVNEEQKGPIIHKSVSTPTSIFRILDEPGSNTIEQNTGFVSMAKSHTFKEVENRFPIICESSDCETNNSSNNIDGDNNGNQTHEAKEEPFLNANLDFVSVMENKIINSCVYSKYAPEMHEPMCKYRSELMMEFIEKYKGRVVKQKFRKMALPFAKP